MSRTTSIGVNFFADFTAIRSQFENFSKELQSRGIAIPFNGQGSTGGAPTSTLSGAFAGTGSLPSALTGAASLNLPMLLSQHGNQVSAAVQQAVQAAVSAATNAAQPGIGASSPNWSAMMQQSMQSAMYPQGASSPNWSMLLNQRGGGGGGGNRGGFAIRGIAALGFALRGVDKLIETADTMRDIDESYDRGDIDGALEQKLKFDQGRRHGFTGLLNRLGSPFHDFVKDEEDDDRRQLASRKSERSIFAVAGRARALQLRTAAVGTGSYGRTVLEGEAQEDALTEEQRPAWVEIGMLRGVGENDKANALQRALNQQRSDLDKLVKANTVEAARIQVIDIRTLNAGGRNSILSAQGFTLEAERNEIGDKLGDEASKEKDTLKRAAIQRRERSEVAAFDIATIRDFGFKTDDARNAAGISQLNAARDIYGAERLAVEGRRQAALRGVPDNWIVNLLGGRALRGALNNEFDAERDEVNARQDLDDRNFSSGIMSRNRQSSYLLSHQPLAARLSGIRTERDKAIRNLRPDQEYLEGFIRTGARSDEQLAIQDEAQTEALGGFNLDTQIGQTNLLLSRQPLAAKLLGISRGAAAQATQLRNQGRNAEALQTIALGGRQSELARQEDSDRQQSIGLKFSTESLQLQRLINNNPVGAEAAGIVGGAIGQATDLRNQGYGGLALQSLGIGMLQLDAKRQEYLRSFRVSDIDSRFNGIFGGNTGGDGATQGQVLAEIAQGKAQLAINGAVGLAQQAGRGIGGFLSSIGLSGESNPSGADSDGAGKDSKAITDAIKDLRDTLNNTLQNLVAY